MLYYLPGSFRRYIRQLGARVADKQFASFVDTKLMRLRCVSDGNGYSLDIEYILDVKYPDDRRPIVLDSTLDDISFVEVKSQVVNDDLRRLGSRGQHLWALSLKPGMTWHEAKLHVKAKWLDSNVLSIPDSVPEVVRRPKDQSISGTIQPILLVQSSSEEVRSLGLRRGLARDEGYFCAALVVRSEENRNYSQIDDLEVYSTLAISEEVWSSFSQRLSQVYTAIADSFSRPLHGEIVMCTSDAISAANLTGATLLVPSVVGKHVDQVLSSSNLAFLLTGLWWGGGCRIVGPLGLTFKTGIGKFMSLKWLFEQDRAVFGNVYQNCVRVAQGERNNLLEDSINSWAVVAVSLFEDMQSNKPVLHILRSLLDEYWGCYLHSDTIADRCSSEGLSLQFR